MNKYNVNFLSENLVSSKMFTFESLKAVMNNNNSVTQNVT